MNQIKKLNVASSPHWKGGSSVPIVQKLWIVALLPAIIASLWLFGLNSLRILSLTIAFSVSLDAIANWVVPSKDYTTNWSSVNLAVLLAFFMPLNAPWWLILIGCFIMIIIGKKLFGGIGAYPVHPVLLSCAMLQISWPQRFDYTASFVSMDWTGKMIEPLRLIKTLGSDATMAFDWQNLLMGRQVAGIGNALVLYLAIGGLFLILIRQITWHIPIAFLVGCYLMGLLLHIVSPEQFATPLFYILSGGTIFGAFFLAPEYTTSPANRIPMLLYGFLGGVLLLLIRAFSVYSDGLIFAILLINLCNPLIDRITPKIYGLEEVKNA